MKPLFDEIAAAAANYKTTIAGIALAVINIYAHGGFAQMNGAQICQAVALCALGVLAKDGTKVGAP